MTSIFSKRWLPLLTLVFLCATAPAYAQTQNFQIKQSVFYDSQSLYYALKCRYAFPVYLRTDVGTQQAPTAPPAAEIPAPAASQSPNLNPNDGVPPPLASNAPPASTTGPTVDHYKIVSSWTGDVLVADCAAADLDKNMDKFSLEEPDQVQLISQILTRNSGSEMGQTFTALKDMYKGNPYLAVFFGDSNFLMPASGNKGGDGIVNATGSMSVVNIGAEALAGFYIDRLNEEVNEAFFIHLQEVLTKQQEIRILFPETVKSLGKIKITEYHQSLNAIKSAFESDLKNLLHNIPGLTTIQRYQTLVNAHPVLTILFATCNLLDMLQYKKSPAEILFALDTANYVRLPLIASKNKNDYAAVIRLAAAISNSLLDVNLSDPPASSLKWVTPATMSTLLNNTQQYKIFMGLLALHIRGIAIGSVDVYAKLMDKEVAERVSAAPTVVNNFIDTYHNISAKVEAINAAGSFSAKVGGYIDIATALTNLTNSWANLLPTGERTSVLAVLKDVNSKYIPLLKQTDKVVESVEDKNYSSAIYQTDTLVVQLLAATGFTIDDAKAKKDTTVANLTKLQKDLQVSHEIFLKYGPFIAALAEAKSSDDVKKAISAFALPVGSSRIKKEHAWSWGLNSYVGLYHAWNHDHLKYNMPAEETGITAPMGLTLNKSLPFGSLSLYAGIIDIGAIFSYQVNNDKSVQSEIKLGQLLSPSLGLVYGFPLIGKYNIPLSIGYNYQWGPRLKSIDTNGNSVVNSLTSRGNLFIAIDIPIVNFHVSDK